MKPQELWNGVIGIGYLCVVFSVIGVVAYVLYGPPFDIQIFRDRTMIATSTAPTSTESNTSGSSTIDRGSDVFFGCSDKRAIKANFKTSAVELTLSDGRSMILPQSLSANLPNGAAGEMRYTNSDGSFVFWNSGNTAFIEESGQVVYSDCVAIP